MNKQRVNKFKASEFKDKGIETMINPLQKVQQLEESKNKNRVDSQWSGNIEDFQLENHEIDEVKRLLKPGLIINNNKDNFAVVIQTETVYVDKSLLIKDIVDGNHIFIAAPQRWGKSLNLTMLRTFFQTDGNDANHYKDNGKYDFSRGNKHAFIFKKLKIEGEKHNVTRHRRDGTEENKVVYYREYEGQFPVIYLNFKEVKNFKNLEELDKKLRDVVSKAYRKHRYLHKKELITWIKFCKSLEPEFPLSDEKIESSDINSLQKIIKKYDIDLTMDLKQLKAYYNKEKIVEAPLHNSINFLVEKLRQYYNKKVFILVDEFDKPVISTIPSIIENLCNEETLEESRSYLLKIASITSRIISPLVKGDSEIGNNSSELENSSSEEESSALSEKCKVILTGIYNTLYKEVSASLNGMTDMGITDSKINVGYFGFDDEDLEYIFNRVFNREIGNEQVMKNLKDKLRYWYNGQLVGDTRMYSPSSVLEYFKRLLFWKDLKKSPKFENYWETATGINFMNIILDIIDRSTINLDNYINILKEIATRNCEILYYNSSKSLIALLQDFRYDAARFESIFSYMLINSGYLTKKDNNQYGYPANEVKIMIQDRIILTWANKTVFLNARNDFSRLSSSIDFYKDDLKTNAINIEKLINLAKKGLEDLNERTFGSIIFAAFLNSKNSMNYKIGLQSSSGNGYLDIIMYFHDRADIYELKFILRSTIYNAEKTLQEALGQIHKKHYMSTVIERINGEESKNGINSIKLIPMLLCKMSSEADYQCKIGSWEEYELIKVKDQSSLYLNVIEKKLVKKGQSDVNLSESEKEKMNDINEDNWSIGSSQLVLDLERAGVTKNTLKIAHSLKEKDFLKAGITEETLKEAKIGVGKVNAPFVVNAIHKILKRRPSEVKFKKTIKQNK